MRNVRTDGGKGRRVGGGKCKTDILETKHFSSLLGSHIFNYTFLIISLDIPDLFMMPFSYAQNRLLLHRHKMYPIEQGMGSVETRSEQLVYGTTFRIVDIAYVLTTSYRTYNKQRIYSLPVAE